MCIYTEYMFIQSYSLGYCSGHTCCIRSIGSNLFYCNLVTILPCTFDSCLSTGCVHDWFFYFNFCCSQNLGFWKTWTGTICTCVRWLTSFRNLFFGFSFNLLVLFRIGAQKWSEEGRKDWWIRFWPCARNTSRKAFFQCLQIKTHASTHNNNSEQQQP